MSDSLAIARGVVQQFATEWSTVGIANMAFPNLTGRIAAAIDEARLEETKYWINQMDKRGRHFDLWGEESQHVSEIEASLMQSLCGPCCAPASVTGKPDRREPHPGETKTPLFNAIWSVVKNWEIQTPNGSWYSATGNDVCQIIDAAASSLSAERQAGFEDGKEWQHIADKATGATLSARAAELVDALRSVNDVQHRMAIELQNIPQEPRIEYWTRKMEDVICTALESEAKAKESA